MAARESRPCFDSGSSTLTSFPMRLCTTPRIRPSKSSRLGPSCCALLTGLAGKGCACKPQSLSVPDRPSQPLPPPFNTHPPPPHSQPAPTPPPSTHTHVQPAPPHSGIGTHLVLCASPPNAQESLSPPLLSSGDLFHPNFFHLLCSRRPSTLHLFSPAGHQASQPPYLHRARALLNPRIPTFPLCTNKHGATGLFVLRLKRQGTTNPATEYVPVRAAKPPAYFRKEGLRGLVKETRCMADPVLSL